MKSNIRSVSAMLISVKMYKNRDRICLRDLLSAAFPIIGQRRFTWPLLIDLELGRNWGGPQFIPPHEPINQSTFPSWLRYLSDECESVTAEYTHFHAKLYLKNYSDHVRSAWLTTSHEFVGSIFWHFRTEYTHFHAKLYLKNYPDNLWSAWLTTNNEIAVSILGTSNWLGIEKG